MSATSKQLALGPMPLQEVGTALPIAAKSVGGTPLVDLFVRAFIRCGYNAQQAAGLLNVSPSDFSKAFSVHWPERNAVMKRWDRVPVDVRREFAALLAADFELSAADTEPVRVLRDLSRLLKAVGE